MRIEISAGGLSAGVAVGEYQAHMAGFVSHVDDIISGFKAVTGKTEDLPGGVGNLQGAVEEIEQRIRQEEEKKEAAVTVRKKTNDFLELAMRVDKQVAHAVNKNRNEFYKTNPWLKPALYVDGIPWYEHTWDWLCDKGEKVAEGIKKGWDWLKDTAGDAWDWTKDTAKKAWNWAKDFYQEHKKIIDTALLVIGAVAAVVAVVVSGGGALIPILTALGCSAGVAAAISGAVAVVAVVSTVAATTLNVIDIWAEIENSTFQAWKKGLNIVSGVSNLLYSVGSIYNSFKHISPAQTKAMMQNALSKNRGAWVNGDYVTFLSDYQPGADSAINRELLTDRSTNHFYAYDNPKGGKIYVSADPCTGSGVTNVVGNSSDEFVVLSGTHGGPNGGLSFNNSYQFFTEDYNSFKNFPNVKVINIQDHIVSLDGYGMVNGYNKTYLKSLIDSGKNIVCAWCYSDRSILVKELLGLM